MSVEMFVSAQCHYCERAKTLLQARGVAYAERDTSITENRDELIVRVPHVRTLPQIFIAGEHIGGFEDLQALADDGRLAALLD